MSEILENNEVLEETSQVEAPITEVETPITEVKTQEIEEQQKQVKEVKPVNVSANSYVLEDFNWDNIGKKESIYSDAERTKLEDLYEKTFKVVKEGELLDGTVVAVTDREVVVNIGYKSESVININEFRSEDGKPKVNDKVEVFVESMEGLDGQLKLSHKKANQAKAWNRVNEACNNHEIVNGFIKSRTKGGMIVEVFGWDSFLPGSQIDVKPIRDFDIYVGKIMEFKVVKINDEFKNVVVSHKSVIEAELEEQKKQIISKLEVGQVLEGIVKNITTYGVFIDLGGVDGLIHITDLAWGRISNPEEVVTLDEKIKVVILDFNEEKNRIALGLKQLTPHPWDALDHSLKVGDTINGKVVVITDYGAFVEIAPGVEGLIHVSEMSWSQHLHSAQDFFKKGDDVNAVILSLEREERKMALGIKQLKPDPWENIEEKYPINSKHAARVRNFTNFGLFVEIEEGVDGLIHISDLSWTKKIKHPNEFTSIGANIEVVVLEIDKENRRLSLGHKQIEENPWDVLETIFTVDSIHKGTIMETSDKGYLISLPNGVLGFTTPAHLKKEDGTMAKINEKLDFKVIEFNKENRRIFVSHSRIAEDLNKIIEEEKQKPSKVKKTKNNDPKIEVTTLGDIEGLAELKEEIKKKEDEMSTNE